MLKETDNNVTPLSWVIVTGVGFVLFIAASVVLMTFSNKAANLSPQIYFFLLIFVALIASGFLFGALKAHAKYSGRVYNGTLALGGPAVIFCIIVYFGLRLAPTANTFDIKFIVFGDESKNELVNGGVLKVLFNKPDSAKIENGVVSFIELPISLLGKTITVTPSVAGYYRQSQQLTIPEDGLMPIEVHLRKHLDSLSVSGLVVDKQGQPVPDVLIVLADGLYRTNANQLGNFSFNLPIKDGTEMPVRIYKEKRLLFNNTLIFSPKTPLTLQLNKL
jgi:hypothetical protein